MFVCCCLKKAKNKKKGRNAMTGEESEDVENKTANIFAFSMMGYGKKKTACQDTFSIMENFGQDLHYFAIYDGHGYYGTEASKLTNDAVEEQLRKKVSNLIKWETDPKAMSKALREIFLKTQERYKKSKVYDFALSGTCAVGVLCVGKYAYVANVGDSRAVIGNMEESGRVSALELSIDHKPFRECEKDRVLKSGGKIEKSLVEEREVGPLRVWKQDEDVPGIAITRSMGDLIAHKIGVISEPEISYKKLENSDKFFVCGSDGVWDVMSSAEAVGFIMSCENREEAAKKLVEECRERWELLNEIKRKQTQIMLETTETDKKKAAEKMASLEKNIVCDDITSTVYYLPTAD